MHPRRMHLSSAAVAAILFIPQNVSCFSVPNNRNSVGNTIGLENSSVSGTSSNALISELNDASRSELDNEQSLSPPIGVIFDMDGTLIRHSIDFAEMRRRIYEVVDADPIGKVLEKDCVLAMPQKLTEDGMRRCHKIFEDIEQKAVDNMKIQDGGAELVQFLKESGLKTAVLTRNVERNVDHMIKLYKKEMNTNFEKVFDTIVARNTKANPDDDEPIKSKPNPDGIHYICKMWECEPSDVIFVGDSANDDMSAANRAGCGGAVLLQVDGCQLDTDSGYAVGYSEAEVMERTPSLCVESLSHLKLCIEEVLQEQENVNDARALRSGREDDLIYASDNFSVTIPSIGVKGV